MITNQSKLDREDEKRMLPCRFFANGACQRGGRCRFYHPTASQIKNVIKVPALPTNFGSLGGASMSTSSQSQQANGTQTAYTPMIMDPRIRSSSTSSSHLSSAGPMTGFGLSGMNFNYGFPNIQSRNYSDYDLDYSSHSSPCESSSSDLSVNIEQNTFFKHINWHEFLAPGQMPPPPVKVPEETPLSPGKNGIGSRNFSSRDCNGDFNPLEIRSAKSSNEDMPPEGSKISTEDQDEKKLTPREELQMKVRQIAKDLAEEPNDSVRVLDSYFLKFDFSAAGYSSIPLSITQTTIMDPKKTAVEVEMVVDSPRNMIAEALAETLISTEQTKM